MEKKVLTAQQARYIKISNLLRGTVILTLAGFATRFIGFFYRIFLSNAMGAELMGIYQLVFPVFTICYTIFAMGIQTALSRLIASETGRGNYRNIYRILRIGILLSVGLALLLSFLVYIFADQIALRFLLEARSASSLRLVAIAFPFCGITACINGYYYGLKKTAVPATTQLVEQAFRVLVVYMIALYAGAGDIRVSCEIAVIGLVAGELASCIYNLTSIFFIKLPPDLSAEGPGLQNTVSRRSTILHNLLSLSVPLSANRLLLSILHSIEAILIPAMLRRSGLSSQDAMVTFGVLNGMSIPFIMFPTAITNALAVLVLPTISEAQAAGNNNTIGKTTSITIKYSLIIGIISSGVFIAFGRDLGNAVFHNEASGNYLTILAWLCPFLYLTSTLGSVINGLGKAHITFVNSVIGTISKIILIATLIPSQGINGYLFAVLIGQLIITALDACAVIRNVRFSFDSINSILKPGIIVAAASLLVKLAYNSAKKMTHINEVIMLLSFCSILCVICLALLFLSKAVSRHDFR